jgi:enoyl-CoA hydratase
MAQGEAAAADSLFDDLVTIMHSDDAQEGVRSFIERRTAKFTGK